MRGPTPCNAPLPGRPSLPGRAELRFKSIGVPWPMTNSATPTIVTRRALYYPHIQRAPCGGPVESKVALISAKSRRVCALGRTLRRLGQGCRRIETKGESRWTKEEKVRSPPRRTARRWNGKSERELVATNRQRPCAPRVRSVDQGRTVRELVGTKVVWSDPAFLRDGCSCWRQVPFGVLATRLRPWSSSARTAK